VFLFILWSLVAFLPPNAWVSLVVSIH
jgi:hypothetical protein